MIFAQSFRLKVILIRSVKSVINVSPIYWFRVTFLCLPASLLEGRAYPVYLLWYSKSGSLRYTSLVCAIRRNIFGCLCSRGAKKLHIASSFSFRKKSGHHKGQVGILTRTRRQEVFYISVYKYIFKFMVIKI